MKLRNRAISALLALAMPCVVMGAEEKTDKPSKPTVTLKLQIVFVKYHGEKKIGSFPYTLAVNSDDRVSKVKSGLQVPLMVMANNAPTWMFKDVATSIQCTANALDDGRFKLYLTTEQSWLHSASDESGAKKAVNGNGAFEPPILRNFYSDVALIMRDGQTTQFTAATDPVNGDVTKIEATLNVLK
jgi:hypothetical protein